MNYETRINELNKSRVTTEKVAELIGVSTQVVLTLRSKGYIESCNVKRGNEYIFDLREVYRYLKEGKKDSSIVNLSNSL